MLVPAQTLSAEGHSRTYIHFFCDSFFCLGQTMYSHIPVDALSEADTNTFKSENWIFHLFTLACVRTLFTMYLFANGMFLRSTKVTCMDGSNREELYCILLFIFFFFFFFFRVSTLTTIKSFSCYFFGYSIKHVINTR